MSELAKAKDSHFKIKQLWTLMALLWENKGISSDAHFYLFILYCYIFHWNQVFTKILVIKFGYLIYNFITFSLTISQLSIFLAKRILQMVAQASFLVTAKHKVKTLHWMALIKSHCFGQWFQSNSTILAYLEYSSVEIST